MLETIMRQHLVEQQNAVSDLWGSRSKAYCKREFNDIWVQIKASHQKRQISDQYLSFLYSSLLAHYLGCLLEAEFDAKITKWSNRLLNSWVED